MPRWTEPRSTVVVRPRANLMRVTMLVPLCAKTLPMNMRVITKEISKGVCQRFIALSPFKSIMIPASENPNLALGDFIYKSVFSIDSTRPTTFEVVLERFGLADSSKGIALNIFYQINNSQSLVAILLKPPSQVFKSCTIKFQASHELPQMEFQSDVPSLQGAVASCSRS